MLKLVGVILIAVTVAGSQPNYKAGIIGIWRMNPSDTLKFARMLLDDPVYKDVTEDFKKQYFDLVRTSKSETRFDKNNIATVRQSISVEGVSNATEFRVRYRLAGNRLTFYSRISSHTKESSYTWLLDSMRNDTLKARIPFADIGKMVKGYGIRLEKADAKKEIGFTLTKISNWSIVPATVRRHTASSDPVSNKNAIGTAKTPLTLRQIINRGGVIYSLRCAGCHGPEGKGSPPRFPALAATALNSREIATKILTGKHAMPKFISLSYTDIAAITTYIDNNWGNAGTGITAEDVSKLDRKR